MKDESSKTKDFLKGNTENKNLKVLSLFSGCGGLDLGFEGGFPILKSQYNKLVNPHWKIKDLDKTHILLPRTRFETVFANDIKPDAKIVWDNYFRRDSSIFKVASIVELVKSHNAELNNFPDSIDVVTGGFPCQDFSVSGKRLGFNSKKSHSNQSIVIDAPCIENRGNLYIWMREVIRITKPKIFVAENVKGLVSLGDAKKIIESDFRNISDGGYLVFPSRVLMAADYGVSQSRERVIFIGVHKKSLANGILSKLEDLEKNMDLDPYPQVTHSKQLDPILKPYVKVSEVLHGLLEPDKTEDEDQKIYSKAKYLGRKLQGQIEINLDGISPTIRSEHHGNIEFRRLSELNGGKYINELNKGMIERRLTIRECARIQSFPDNYAFIKKGINGVSGSKAYKLIGNAVPPLLGFHIAKRLEDLWPIYFEE